MKLISIGVLLFAIISAGCVLAQPRITIVPGSEFDFGRVYKGTKAKHSLLVKNTGTDTLNITDVSAQCGCTATLMSKRAIAPNESADLSITFNTAEYDGKVMKHVYVSSNDTSASDLEIEFTAYVVQSLTPDPAAVTFMVSKADSTYTSSLTLTNSTPDAIHILSVTSVFDGLQTRLFKNELMPGEQTEMQVSLRPQKIGSYKGTLQLRTDHAAQPVVEIDVLEINTNR
jgi:hypothetical protein